VVTCKPEDEIHEVLHTMAEKQVRRLPVVNNEGVPQGILSMDDIITHGDLNKWQGCCELSAEEIIRATEKTLRPEDVRGSHERRSRLTVRHTLSFLRATFETSTQPTNRCAS
jgi:signal-transduction protein with cAMP-binding, CBS, and nucleotidyltransferase domain